MKKFYKSEQSGRSMVEMLGVLAIIGVLSVGGISGYSKAMSKYRVNKTMDQISMLVMNIRSLYSSSVDYDGFNTKNALAMGAIPGDMQSATTSKDSEIYNAYQGQVILGTASGNRQFLVTYHGMPKDACITLLTSDWGSQAGSGLESIAVGKTNTDKKSGNIGSTKDTNYFTVDLMPVSLAKASTACTDDGDGNSVQWVYY